MRARHILLLRKSSQIIFLIIFIVLVFISRAQYFPAAISNLYFQMDPLLTITASISGRILVSGMLLTALTLLTTILFGRVWCSWFCPLGTILEIIKPKKNKAIRPSEHLRKIKYIVLITIILLAIAGAEFYTYLDPITIFQRSLTISLIPALKAIIFQLETILYKFEVLWGAADWVNNNILYPLFQDIDSFFRFSTLTFLIFALIISLNWIAERFWCRYLCPLGALFGFLSKFSLFKRVVTGACTSCKQCADICPTGTIDIENEFTSDPAECTMCFECKDVCQFNANQFIWVNPIKQPRKKFSYDPGRRELLTGFGAAVGSFALAEITMEAKEDFVTMIRPPGAIKGTFESKCIRCSKCLNVCPTQGLQLIGFENGWENLFTPRLIPRAGYCDYNCTACIDICPTDAISQLTLEEKQITPIGLARIDQNRCLPWAYQTSCIICEEACPLPDKAVKFQEEHILNHKGEDTNIKRPYVVRELCIGCGICEHKCPLTGEAAIRVFTLPKDIDFLYPPG